MKNEFWNSSQKVAAIISCYALLGVWGAGGRWESKGPKLKLEDAEKVISDFMKNTAIFMKKDQY